eukprot:748844-Hanusia_phi.AAC.3
MAAGGVQQGSCSARSGSAEVRRAAGERKVKGKRGGRGARWRGRGRFEAVSIRINSQSKPTSEQTQGTAEEAAKAPTPNLSLSRGTSPRKQGHCVVSI